MRVYGEWFDNLMLARMRRERTETVTRVVFERGHYAVRGYIEANPYNPTEEVYFYHLRRDGKVERSWVPLPVTRVVERHGELMLADATPATQRPAKRPAPVTTEADANAALAVVREREAKFLDPEDIAVNAINPFRRRGVTHEEVAYALNWVTDRMISGGFMQADLPKTRKVFKELIKRGDLIELGHERTLDWRSRTMTTFSTPDFIERGTAALKAWHAAKAQEEKDGAAKPALPC